MVHGSFTADYRLYQCVSFNETMASDRLALSSSASHELCVTFCPLYMPMHAEGSRHRVSLLTGLSPDNVNGGSGAPIQSRR